MIGAAERGAYKMLLNHALVCCWCRQQRKCTRADALYRRWVAARRAARLAIPAPHTP
ncbi:hypothetical protein [Streptomyces nodosus]|uniref:hypothetical protein n=1 Tax=Streptomyces nodosus TaxID=40318 RepID=UPI003802B8BF